MRFSIKYLQRGLNELTVARDFIIANEFSRLKKRVVPNLEIIKLDYEIEHIREVIRSIESGHKYKEQNVLDEIIKSHGVTKKEILNLINDKSKYSNGKG